MSPKIKALLATGRTSNLPTVWSNILIAHLLIIGAEDFTGALLLPTEGPELTLYITSLTISCLAASLIYIGGCFLGDAIDANFDATHKPDRPIPSGILNRSIILSTSLLLLAVGTLLPTLYFQNSGAEIELLFSPAFLTTAVILYSWLHKKSPLFGLPLIGACRFFLILFGAAVADAVILSNPDYHYSASSELDDEIILYAATAVGLYTICFASVARTESSKTPFSYRNTIALIMAALPFLFFIGIAVEAKVDTLEEIKEVSSVISGLSTLPVIIIAYLNYWIWFAASLTKLKTNKKGAFVSMSLAGFCLLDATIAALFGWTYLLITLALFALALLLQKIAPAT